MYRSEAIVEAWRDEDFLGMLSEAEQNELPENPAGKIKLVALPTFFACHTAGEAGSGCGTAECTGSPCGTAECQTQHCTPDPGCMF